MSDFGGFLPGDGQGVFAPGRMIDAARARAGPLALDPLAEEGLHVLCDDLQGQATRFSFAGKKLLQAALIEALVKRRGLREPAVPRRAVFIVAPFRSGTTLLHRLLAEDARLRAPRTYEVSLAPVPGAPDPRIGATAAYLRRIAKRSPELARLHPVGAELPEECFGLLEPSFLSPSFLFWAPLGRYFGWLETRGQEDWRRAYDIYAAGLSRHGAWPLADEEPRAHVGPVGAAGAFPGCAGGPDPPRARGCGCLVSQARRRPSPHLSRRAGRCRGGRFRRDRGAHRIARAAAARRDHGEDRFIDLSFETLVADPLSVVRGLWSRLDLPEDEAALARMARSLAA